MFTFPLCFLPTCAQFNHLSGAVPTAMLDSIISQMSFQGNSLMKGASSISDTEQTILDITQVTHLTTTADVCNVDCVKYLVSLFKYFDFKSFFKQLNLVSNLSLLCNTLTRVGGQNTINLDIDYLNYRQCHCQVLS